MSVQIPVWIEKIGIHRYRAKMGEPVSAAADADTAAEALNALAAEVSNRLQDGNELAVLDLPTSVQATLPSTPIFPPNDPYVRQWIDIMKENRKRMDEDPDTL